MFGTVITGGKRDGAIIRAILSTPLASPFGEVDGSITPRLIQLVKTLRSAGIKAEVLTDMIDHQMTHAVEVALIGKLTLKYHCDLHALARSKKDLKLFVDARREAHQVLRALGHKIIPRSEEAIRIIPGFVQVAVMRMMLNSKLGEVGLGHVSQSADEVQQLADELSGLVDQANLPVP